MTEETHSCPSCGAELEDGFVGYASGLLWSGTRLDGLRRMFPFALGEGRFVLGSWSSVPWFRQQPAERCRRCGTLVIPAAG